MSRATGGSIRACASRGRAESASGGPSTSTMSGESASSPRRRLRAQPGPWCRMPKTCALMSAHLPAGAIQVFPAVPLLDRRLQVFEPDDTVLHGILNDRADDARRQVVRLQGAVAEVRGERQAVIQYRDGLRGTQGAARRLQFGLPVRRKAAAKLPEDRHHAAY